PGDVVVRDAVVRQHADLQQAPPHSRLPRAKLRLERHNVLHPPVRRHQLPGVTPDGAHVAGAGASDEAGVDAAVAAVNTWTLVDPHTQTFTHDRKDALVTKYKKSVLDRVWKREKTIYHLVQQCTGVQKGLRR